MDPGQGLAAFPLVIVISGQGTHPGAQGVWELQFHVRSTVLIADGTSPSISGPGIQGYFSADAKKRNADMFLWRVCVINEILQHISDR